MYKYIITLKLFTYDWSSDNNKRIELSKTFTCDSWDAAKDLIGLMVDSTEDTLTLEIKKQEVEA